MSLHCNSRGMNVITSCNGMDSGNVAPGSNSACRHGAFSLHNCTGVSEFRLSVSLGCIHGSVHHSHSVCVRLLRNTSSIHFASVGSCGLRHGGMSGCCALCTAGPCCVMSGCCSACRSSHVCNGLRLSCSVAGSVGMVNHFNNSCAGCGARHVRPHVVCARNSCRTANGNAAMNGRNCCSGCHSRHKRVSTDLLLANGRAFNSFSLNTALN